MTRTIVGRKALGRAKTTTTALAGILGWPQDDDMLGSMAARRGFAGLGPGLGPGQGARLAAMDEISQREALVSMAEGLSP